MLISAAISLVLLALPYYFVNYLVKAGTSGEKCVGHRTHVLVVSTFFFVCFV
jgi:hypothetical protein